MILDRILPNRFARNARRCVELAVEEARRLGHDSVGDEDLLLGILRDGESEAAGALRSVGVTLEAAREQSRLRFEEALSSIGISLGDVVEQAGDTFRFETPHPGRIPFSPAAKKALERSLHEALRLGDNRITSEHVLLGIIRPKPGAAAKVLGGLGIEVEEVEQAVLRARGDLY